MDQKRLLTNSIRVALRIRPPLREKRTSFQENSSRQYSFRWLYHLIISAILLAPLPSQAIECQGNIALEGRYFIEDPGYPHQERNNGSLAIEPELYHAFSTGSSLVVKPFARLDSGEDQRTHWDIREAKVLYL